jgi:hypothetical protein
MTATGVAADPVRRGGGAWVTAALVPVVAGSAALALISPKAALAATVAVALVACLLEAPIVLVAASIPACFLSERVLADSAAVSDVVLAVAVGVALLVVMDRTDTRRVVRAIAPFLGLQALFVLALTPALATSVRSDTIIEVGQRLVLMAGGTLIGGVLWATGQFTRAVRWFLIVAAGFAAAVLVDTATGGGPRPIYPLGLSKNHVGGMLAIAAVVSLSGRFTGRWRHQWVLTLALVGAIYAMEARLGLVAFAVAGGYTWWTTRPQRRWIAVALAVPLVCAAAWSLTRPTDVPVQQTSAGSRSEFNERSLSAFEAAPVVGQGIRWYVDPEVDYPQALSAEDAQGGIRNPHNVMLEVLSEAGLIGFGGLVTLVGGTWFLLRPRRSGGAQPTAVLQHVARAAVLGTFVLGLADLYWVNGRTQLPWFFLGSAAVAAMPVTIGRAAERE